MQASHQQAGPPDLKTKASFEKFLKPGAMHSARWMAKLIYSLEVVLLGSAISELPKGAVCSTSQMEKLKRFMEAMVFIYIPWWLTCSSSSLAPIHDLSLLMDLNSWGTKW